MNLSKWFFISFICTVLSFLALFVATAICWIKFVSINVLFFITTPLTAMTILFFLGFCVIGEKIKENAKVKRAKNIVRNSKRIIAEINHAMYVRDRVA